MDKAANCSDFCYVEFIFSIFKLGFETKKVDIFGLTILTLFLYISFIAKRNLALFYFSYLIFVEDYLVHFQKIHRHFRETLEKWVVYVFIFYLLFFAPFRFLESLKLSNYDGYCMGGSVKYPCRLISEYDFEKGARIYNRYEWGGYLIKELPDQKIFVDGRMPAWINNKKHESPYLTYLHILQTKGDWVRQLANLQTDYILISPYTFMDLERGVQR